MEIFLENPKIIVTKTGIEKNHFCLNSKVIPNYKDQATDIPVKTIWDWVLFLFQIPRDKNKQETDGRQNFSGESNFQFSKWSLFIITFFSAFQESWIFFLKFFKNNKIKLKMVNWLSHKHHSWICSKRWKLNKMSAFVSKISIEQKCTRIFDKKKKNGLWMVPDTLKNSYVHAGTYSKDIRQTLWANLFFVSQILQEKNGHNFPLEAAQKKSDVSRITQWKTSAKKFFFLKKSRLSRSTNIIFC